MTHIPEPEYKRILALIPIICVDVAIVCNGSVLLIRRKEEPAKGEWWLPGGRLHRGELIADCALRKATEEVGMIGNWAFRGKGVVHWQSTIFESVHSVNFVYKFEARSFEPISDGSWLGYKWVTSQGDYHPYINSSLAAVWNG